MKPHILPSLALILAIGSLALNVFQYYSFQERVERVVADRERNYIKTLVQNLNKSREMMGQSPVAPTNFAEVINAYLESVSEILDGRLSYSTNTPTAK